MPAFKSKYILREISSVFFVMITRITWGKKENVVRLAAVNYAVGISQGGTTDDSGRFFITVNSKTNSVVFSYIGYKDEALKKRFFRKDSIIVKLHLENFMLEEFTVKAKKGKIPKDTAAIRIFRNVVANKKENRPKSFSSYQYEEYLKTVASLYNIKITIIR